MSDNKQQQQKPQKKLPPQESFPPCNSDGESISCSECELVEYDESILEGKEQQPDDNVLPMRPFNSEHIVNENDEYIDDIKVDDAVAGKEIPLCYYKHRDLPILALNITAAHTPASYEKEELQICTKWLWRKQWKGTEDTFVGIIGKSFAPYQHKFSTYVSTVLTETQTKLQTINDKIIAIQNDNDMVDDIDGLKEFLVRNIIYFGKLEQLNDELEPYIPSGDNQ
eukprot:506784_1